MSTHEIAPVATSSIGAVWPPIPTNNDRLKGFYPETVTDLPTLGDVERVFWHSHEASDDELSRTTVRFVGSTGILHASIERGLPVEADVPLAGEHDLRMIYIATNKDNRHMSQEDLARHHQVLRESRRAMSHKPAHTSEGRTVNILTGSEAVAHRMTDQFMGLYATFGFSQEDVEELLQNPNNTIAYLHDRQGDIVSTCLAEHGVVTLNNYDVSLYEITEAVTRPDQRGKGLYTRVSGTLERFVVDTHVRQDLHNGNVVAVYGESNLSSPGVIYAARRNGRILAADIPPVTGAGSTNGRYGILEQNYKVNDGRETRPYNDFAVSYQPIG